jgi:hypothetical protein
VEVFDLLSRDITPEDYDLLLRLDKAVAPKTVSADGVEALPVVTAEEFMGGNCAVCMCSFEASDTVSGLPCRHHFHKSCIAKWLSECRKTCPLCGEDVEKASS